MRKAIGKTYIALILLFLYMPILLLIFFSFNAGHSNVIFSGFSLHWYAELFQDEHMPRALANTLIIASISSVAATIIGTMAALRINKLKRFFRSVVMNVTYIPVLNPDIITGVSLMLLFIALNIPLGYFTVIIAHITFNIPYVILAIMPKLRQTDPHIVEAANDLGASPFQAFWKILFPQILPGILSGLLMAFTLSVDDFVITFFLRGTSVETLATVIYTNTKQKIPLTINALCALMFVIVLLILILANLPYGKKNKKELENF